MPRPLPRTAVSLCGPCQVPEEKAGEEESAQAKALEIALQKRGKLNKSTPSTVVVSTLMTADGADGYVNVTSGGERVFLKLGLSGCVSLVHEYDMVCSTHTPFQLVFHLFSLHSVPSVHTHSNSNYTSSIPLVHIPFLCSQSFNNYTGRQGPRPQRVRGDSQH